MSIRRQQQLIQRLRRYLHRFSTQKIQATSVKLGKIVLISLLNTYSGHTQTYVQPPCSNALGSVDVGTFSYPVFGDLNGDNLQDVFIGNGDGQISFLTNTGTATSPVFTPATGAANPLNGVDVGNNATPFLVNIDGDGDLDIFIGNKAGTLAYFRNDGTATAPVYNQQMGANHPLAFVNVGGSAAPNFVDIDADGDLDAFVAGSDVNGGAVHFFRNDGTATVSMFTPVSGSANPLNSTPFGANPLLTFKDNDQDGDFDLFVGSQLGMIQYYENTGTTTSPTFQLTTGSANPFAGIDVGRNAAPIPNPCFVDINGDGNMDVFIGSSNGTVNYFENRPATQCPDLDYSKRADAANPANMVDVGADSEPDFVDINGDGDLDLFVANGQGNIQFFENTGTTTAPIFTPATGAANPFDGVDVGDNATIGFVDINGDNVPDAFVGEADGTVNFFQNTGTANIPNFQPATGAANPFNGVDVGSQSSPTFVDIDQDGDFDAFIGDQDGRLQFFRNDGTPLVANFVPVTDATNPFFGVNLEGNFTPTFADVDQDGDFDAIIGNKTGFLLYFRNEGTATNPKFVGLYGVCNPFNGLLSVTTTSEEFSKPVAVDIDGDGFVEIFSGRFDGKLCFLDKNVVRIAPRQPIPTFSQWGKLLFLLLILNLSVYWLYEFRKVKKHFLNES